MIFLKFIDYVPIGYNRREDFFDIKRLENINVLSMLWHLKEIFVCKNNLTNVFVFFSFLTFFVCFSFDMKDSYKYSTF